LEDCLVVQQAPTDEVEATVPMEFMPPFSEHPEGSSSVRDQRGMSSIHSGLNMSTMEIA
jgi:hypothetical protein